MSDIAISHTHYKNPPVVERLLTVTADVTQEAFFTRLSEWKRLVHEKFPEYDPINEWQLNIETRKEGPPLLTNVEPTLTITHRFWRRDKKNRRFLSMRLLPNQFTLNIHPASESDHPFDELLHEFSIWIPQWMTHFGANACRSVSLSYINVISKQTTPQFVGDDGGIQVGSVLNVFSNIPSKHLGIIPPYDCQMGLMIDPSRPAYFSLRVFAVEAMTQPASSAIRVDLNAAVVKPDPSLTAIEALSEAGFLHNVIRDQFEAIFTDSAKNSFEPITR